VPTPYIVRFISTRSGVGKTTTASFLVRELKTRGYLVSAVKHAVSELSLEEKDSKKYLESGADVVVVSSSNLVVVYVRGHRDILEDAIIYARTPVIVVEGFRESRVGDVVLVASSSGEIEYFLTSGVKPLAVVFTGTEKPPVSGVRVIGSRDLAELVNLVESRVVEHFLEQTPRLNCGKCNYSTCRELVEAYVRGKASWCPVTSKGVKLQVDNVEIPLNPFVKSILKSTIQGLVSVLRGVPVTWSKITVTINREE